ncbi:hypothetical protein DFJ77DRAFT_166253 [Powellomyces hirtus]|nr:hypothetical protein DFJ77DRAFT_166253 [Powellomyces hirtus]
MDCVELINALLAYNPDERISSKDALKYAYFKDMPDSELERSPTSRSAAASGGPFKTKSARRKGSLHNVSLSIPQLPTAVVVATGAKGGGGKKIETESDPDSRPVPTNTYLKSSKPAVTHSTTHNTTTTITTTITNKADAPSHHPAAHPATVIPTASGVAPTSTPPAGKQETQHHDSHQQQHPAIQQQHSLSSLLAKSGKPHHTTTTVAAAQLRTRQDPPADPPALTGGTLMAIAQHVRTGPFITSTSITTQQQPTQHQPVAASSSTTSLPPIAQMLTGGSTATGGTSTSAFYAKFKQDDKRAAAAVAAAVMDQGAPRLHGRLRASAGPNKKVPPRSLGQPQGGAQAAPSTDSKAPQWGATVVGKNAVVQSHKLPSIGPTQAHSIHPQHKSLHQAAAASSNTTVLPNLPSHMPKHETGDAKSRPKELLVLPSLGSEKTTSKQTTNHSTASPAPTVFPAIKHLGGSKPGGN